MASLDTAPARRRSGRFTVVTAAAPATRPSPPDAGGLGPQGFRLIELPAVPPRLLARFRSLPLTGRVADAVLYRRTHQVRMAWTADDDWLFTMAGTAGFGTHPDEAGRPLRTEVTSLLWRALGGLWLDVYTDWHIDVHQQRFVVPATAKAPARPPLPPAGPSLSAHDDLFAMIAIVDVRRAEGGVTLRRRGSGDGTGSDAADAGKGAATDAAVTQDAAGSAPLWNRPLRADQALLVDLRAVEYDLWDMAGDGRNPAVQDMLISVISRHRRG